MSSTAAPNVNDLGRGPAIMGVLWTYTTIALVVVIARLRVRHKTHALFWDDWFMLMAMVRGPEFATVEKMPNGRGHVIC
jgi:hypothetical protein